jgi:hypothetical protein
MPRRTQALMTAEIMSLQAAAARSGQSVIRLGRWCATGRIRCERDETGWSIAVSELPAIAIAAREHARAVEENRVTAIAVPVPAVPPDLAGQVASRLGLPAGHVSITRLALDGAEYVVAVWPGDAAGGGGLPAVRQLAVELGAELLDGEVKRE